MRILVLGARGMMGHMACRILGERHEVFGTTRTEASRDEALARFLSSDRWVPGVDAHRIDTVRSALASVAPEVSDEQSDSSWLERLKFWNKND